MTDRHLISLGANLGDAKNTLLTAIAIFESHFGEESVRASRLYRTPPVGGPSGQGDFHNAVVAIDCEMDPFALWSVTRDIETQLGRVRNERWEARRIDIDLLLSSDVRIWTPHLKVPHPRMMMRKFILEPAVEVAADWIDPVSGHMLEELRNRCRRNAKCILVVSHDRELLENVLASTAKIPKRLTEHDFDGYYLDLSSDQIVIAVICEPDELRERLPYFLPTVARITNDVYTSSSRPKDECVAFVAAAVASRDVTTIAWEDAAKPWSSVLGMTASTQSASSLTILKSACPLPRYLLDASDPKWAAHELVAAFDAMNCEIEPI